MAEEHRTRVVIEGDTSGFARSADAGRTSAQRFEQAVSKNKDAVGKMGGALKAAVPNVVAMSTAGAASAKSVSGLASAIFAGAKAFGPWGLAIGFAGDALVSLVSSSNAAADATRKLTRELILKDAAARDARRAEELDTFNRKQRAVEETRAAQTKMLQDRKIAETAEDLRGIEDALAMHGRGKDTLALQREENRIRAENLRIQGDTAGAAALERDFQLQTLSLLNQQNVARGGKGSVAKPAFRAGTLAGASPLVRDDSRAFAAEAGRVGAMQRDGGDTRGANDAQYAADARLRAIEVERATTGETIALINAERDARMALLQTQIDASTTGAERMALKQEQEQVAHEATLQRIAQEQAAEEKRMAKSVAYQNMAASLANSGVALGGKIAQAAGVSAKKREKIERGLGAAQAIVIGSLEVVKAAAAFALPFGVGVPEGIAHTAAAAVAFATAAALGAGGGGGGASGGGAASAGGGASQSPRGAASPGSTSPIPGSPSPQAPSVGGGGSDRAPRRIVQINGPIHLYGTPERDWLSSLEQAQEVHRSGSRSRRAS